MGKKNNCNKTYYIAVTEDKVRFLGTDVTTIYERAKNEGIETLHRISACSYRDAALWAAESFQLRICEEVQETIKLLHGFR